MIKTQNSFFQAIKLTHSILKRLKGLRNVFKHIAQVIFSLP